MTDRKLSKMLDFAQDLVLFSAKSLATIINFLYDAMRVRCAKNLLVAIDLITFEDA